MQIKAIHFNSVSFYYSAATIAHWPVTSVRGWPGSVKFWTHCFFLLWFSYCYAEYWAGESEVSEISEVSEVFPFLFKLPILKEQVLESAAVTGGLISP